MRPTGRDRSGDLPPEQELLLCCARSVLDAPRRERLASLCGRPLSWDVLFGLAEFHGLIPLLYKHLARESASTVPEPFLTRCQRFVLRAQFDVLGKCSALLALLQRFAAEGIPLLTFKGAVAGAAYYGDPGLRPFNDLDLLVPRAHARRAWGLLAHIGYAPTIPLSESWQGVDIHTRNERMFFKAESPVVDLHWSLMPLYYSFTPRNRALWRRAEVVPLAGCAVPTLSPEDALFFYCLHGAKHGWSKMRWVCDVAELARARPGLDWERVLRWADRHGAARMVRIALALAHRLLDAPIPAGVLRPGEHVREEGLLVGEILSGLLAYPPRPEPDAELPWRSFFFRCMDRARDRIRWVYEIIFLPTELEWGLLPLPTYFVPLYFPVRLIRLGLKYVPRRLRRLRGRATVR